MTLPKEYRTAQERFILSFNFSDAVTQTGYITFYGVVDEASAEFLTPVTIESDETSTTDSAVVSPYSLRDERDFDIEFKKPQTVGGRAFIASTIITSNGSGANSAGTYLKIRIYHFDGTTETEIGTQQSTSSLDIAPGAASTQYARNMCSFSVNDTLFAIGDKLRVNVELWVSVGGAGGGYGGYFHDGKNRDLTGTTTAGEAVPTDLKCIIPFRIK